MLVVFFLQVYPDQLAHVAREYSVLRAGLGLSLGVRRFVRQVDGDRALFCFFHGALK